MAILNYGGNFVNKTGDTMTGALTVLTVIFSGITLTSDIANTLTQRNGANPQALHVHNTFTDVSNGDWGTFDFTSNAAFLTIGTARNGTGLVKGVVFNSTSNQYIWQLSGANVLQLIAASFQPLINGNLDLGATGAGWKRLYIDYTNTGTVGAVTINKAAGRVNIAAAGTSVVVTNNLVTAASKVFCTVSTNDTTALFKNAVPAAGSFTITMNATVTAQTSIDFFIVNAD